MKQDRFTFDLTAPLAPATTLTADWTMLDAKYRSRIVAYSPFDEPGVLLGRYGLLRLSGSVRYHKADVTLGIRNARGRASTLAPSG